MAVGIQIDGDKLAALWRESVLPQELFAAKMGLGRSGLGRLTRPGVHGVHARRLVKLAESLGIDVRDLQKRLAPAPGKAAGPPPADTAVARLLGGRTALLTELEAAAAALGVTLPELFRRISREWLAANAKPFNGVHTGLDAAKQRPAPARPQAIAPASPPAPARVPRAEGRAKRGRK